MVLVIDNQVALKDRGIYEEALVMAFTGARMNHSQLPEGVLSFLFEQADKSKLRAAGDANPNEPTTIYRGVSGHGPLPSPARVFVDRFAERGVLVRHAP